MQKLIRAQKADNIDLHQNVFEETKKNQDQLAKTLTQEQEELDTKIKVRL